MISWQRVVSVYKSINLKAMTSKIYYDIIWYQFKLIYF